MWKSPAVWVASARWLVGASRLENGERMVGDVEG